MLLNGYFLFFTHSLETLEMVVRENSSRLAGFKTLYAIFKVTSVTFLPLPEIELLQIILTMDKCKCTEAFSCDWLIR